MTELDTILIVEDNENDVFFMKRALAAAGFTNPLAVAEDGQKALDYLAAAGKSSNRIACPFPELILLDIKLPEKRGLDVLAWLRQQSELREVIVVILTSSSEPSDIRDAYRLGANSYLVKPATIQRLTDMARALKLYWLEFNCSPRANMNGF
jgi:CheY-like chemotaxis protein